MMHDYFHHRSFNLLIKRMMLCSILTSSLILVVVALNLWSTNASQAPPSNTVVKVVKDVAAGMIFGPQALVLNLIRKVDPKLAVALVSTGVGFNLGLAYTGKVLQFRPLTKIARTLLFFTKTTRNTVFPSIEQPPELRRGQAKDELVYTTGTSSLEIVETVLKAKPLLRKVVGKPKRDLDGFIDYEAFNAAYNTYVTDSCFNRVGNEFLPKDYHYFGVYDGVGTMEAFLKYNPYIGASLNAKVSSLFGWLTGFEIDPYDDSLFSKFVADLTDDIPRVVVKLDCQLKVTDMKVYIGKTLETRRDVTHLYSKKDDIAYMALYQILYYAQNIHASTHLFHQLLTASLSRATEPYPDIHSWAKVYNVNIGLKYKEIEVLLYNQGGFFNANVSNTVSGFSTFQHSSVVTKAAELNNLWSSFRTADEYVYDFLFKNVKKEFLDQAGIAVEYRKQVALSGEFSSELEAELKKLDGFEAASTSFAALNAETGALGVSSVKTIKQFIELMTASSLLHGSTLSMTRLNICPAIVSLINYENPNYTSGDTKYISILLGTIAGSLEGYTVYSSKLPYKGTPFGIINVLKKYEGLSEKLKVDFYNEITKDQSYFKKFGWIQTDHAPEGIDGKQYTISTYI